MTLPRNVNRWRQRRNTIVSTSRTAATPNSVHPVATRSTARDDVGEPAGADAGDRPQDGGVDLIGDPAGPRRQRGDDEPRDERPRSRRSSPCRCARCCRGSGGGAPDGRRRRRVRRAVGGTYEPASAALAGVVDGGFGVQLRRHDAPPTTTRRAIRGRRSPRSPPAAAFSSRTAAVVSVADTASITATTSSPQRSTTSLRTSGVMFSAGCRPRSSTSSTRPSRRSPDRS